MKIILKNKLSILFGMTLSGLLFLLMGMDVTSTSKETPKVFQRIELSAFDGALLEIYNFENSKAGPGIINAGPGEFGTMFTDPSGGLSGPVLNDTVTVVNLGDCDITIQRFINDVFSSDRAVVPPGQTMSFSAGGSSADRDSIRWLAGESGLNCKFLWVVRPAL